MLGTLTSAFVLTYVGRFFDKYGARVTSVLAGLLLGCSLFYLSASEHIVSFLNKVFGLNASGTVTFIVLILGFFLIRFFGQGTLTMSSRNMVMKWYEKRRGMASAVMGIAISFGFSYSPRVFDALIENFTWQGTWQILAITVGVVFSLFAFITFRDNPEQHGLIPDGKEITSGKSSKVKYKAEKDFQLKDARKTLNFWVFNLSLTLHALYITALTFHVIDIFQEGGLSRMEAINIFLPVSVVAVAFQLGGGYLADRIKLKYLLIVTLLGMLISMLGLFLLAPGIPVILIIAGNGIEGGLFGVLSSVTWPRFYGTKHLGEISGFSMSWVVAGSAVGPYLFSMLKNITGSYTASGLLMMLTATTLLVLSFFVQNKNRTLQTK